MRIYIEFSSGIAMFIKQRREEKWIENFGGSETWREVTLERYRPIWEDNIKIYLTEKEWEDMDFVYLYPDRSSWLAVFNTAARY